MKWKLLENSKFDTNIYSIKTLGVWSTENWLHLSVSVCVCWGEYLDKRDEVAWGWIKLHYE
jgi:hypothetical protein